MSDELIEDQNRAKQLSLVGVRTFLNISSLWGLSDHQRMVLLGYPDPHEFLNWKDGLSFEGVTQDTMMRISYILGIYKSLQILLPEPAAADSWIHKPNLGAIFGGKSALDLMLSGKIADLERVRTYLDGKLGM